MTNANVVKMKVLSVEVLKENLHYEPTTGLFTWVKGRSGTKIGNIAGTLNKDGYINIKINCKRYKAHRLAWLYVNGSMPESLIDHINGNKNDNRICNLREATQKQNMRNQSNPQKGNKSGYLGVSFKKEGSKYAANIRINGKNKHLGYFAAAKDAHEVYLKAKKELHSF